MDEELDAPRSSMGPLILGLALVAVLGAGGFVFLTMMAPSYDATELLANGESVDAEIISARKTGEQYEGKFVYELELQVYSDEGRGHRVFHQQPFGEADEPKLTKTTKVRVKMDPQDRQKVWVTEVDGLSARGS